MTINLEKHNRNINLICPTCGGNNFDYDDNIENDSIPHIKCLNCALLLSKDDLLKSNSQLMDETVKEIARDCHSDVEKELKSMLKKSFGNSKYIKIT